MLIYLDHLFAEVAAVSFIKCANFGVITASSAEHAIVFSPTMQGLNERYWLANHIGTSHTISWAFTSRSCS
jgi:hypothetical protein